MDDDFYNAFANAGLVEPDNYDQSYSYVDSSGNAPSAGFNFTPFSQGLKLGGSIFGAFGQYQQGKQTAKALNYNADLALLSGDFELDKLDGQASILASQQRAGYLKAGVELTGSPLDVMMETASQIDLDKQIVKFNTQSKADMLRYEGEVAKNQAKFKAGQSLASGGLGLLLGA